MYFSSPVMSIALLVHVILLEVTAVAALGLNIMARYKFPLHAVFYASEVLHLSYVQVSLSLDWPSTFSYIQSIRYVALNNIQANFVSNCCCLSEKY